MYDLIKSKKLLVHNSALNIFINISSIQTLNTSLDSPHWKLQNELFNT